MAPTRSCTIAAGLVFSTCPLAAHAFVPAGSRASRPEDSASFRGTGAASLDVPVQVESSSFSVSTILSVSGLAGVTASIAGRGHTSRTAMKARKGKGKGRKTKGRSQSQGRSGAGSSGGRDRGVAPVEVAEALVEEAEAPPPPPKWELATSLGALPPLGSFDPLGFSDSEEKFKDFRAKELKHGRLAMMAAVGLLVQSIVQVPGMEGVPKNIFAITAGNGLIGGVAILAIIGILEAVVFVQDPDKEPGNFGNPLPLVGDDYSEDMRLKELNNGRMAMGSFLLVAGTSLATGKSALQQFGVGLAESATEATAVVTTTAATAAAPAATAASATAAM